MNRIRIFAIIVIASSQCLLAQETDPVDQVLLHGVVMDANTMNPIPNVHYIISNQFGGATTGEGKFSMYINRNDSVVFTYIGFSDFVFSLSDTLIGKSFVAGIFMETDTLSLGEVIVLPRMSDLRTEFRNTDIEVPQEIINAQNNIEVATYQGLNSAAALGDPHNNYEMLRRKQVITAFEKGGIPSDKMLGLNVITVLPMAIYLLKNGLPERPEPPAPHVSDRELNKMVELYKKSLHRESEK